MIEMAGKVAELEKLHLRFAELFNSRDVDGLLALMAPGAVFVPAPGHPLSGEVAIRGGLEQFLAVNLPIEMNVRHVYQSGNYGLGITDWNINGTGPDGSEVSMSGSTSDVAVYDEEHGWRLLIDNPNGTA